MSTLGLPPELLLAGGELGQAQGARRGRGSLHHPPLLLGLLAVELLAGGGEVQLQHGAGLVAVNTSSAMNSGPSRVPKF